MGFLSCPQPPDAVLQNSTDLNDVAFGKQAYLRHFVVQFVCLSVRRHGEAAWNAAGSE